MSEEKKDINQEQSATQPTEQTPESPVSQESIPQAPIPPEMGMPIPPPVSVPNGWRGRMMRVLMGQGTPSAAVFPKWLSQYAVGTYILALAVVTVVYSSYALPWYYMLSGLVSVLIFFLYGRKLAIRTSPFKIKKSKNFEKRIFLIAFIPRIIWMFTIYLIFMQTYGDAFGFENGDAIYYNDLGQFVAGLIEKGNFHFYDEISHWSGNPDVADMGYGVYVGFIYWLTGNSIIVIRLLKCIWSSLTVVLLYRLARRNFGEQTARLTALFCALWPNFWYYCGGHLKESEMVFLVVLFVEQADQMLRSRQFTTWKVVPVLLIAAAIFTFRTPLGLVALLALILSAVMSSTKVVSWGKRIVVGLVAVGLIVVVAGNRIQEKAQVLIEQAQEGQQETNMEWRGERANGNAFSKYAGAAVFAPMIFTLPFPTMVHPFEGQNVQQLLNGGNFIKNILSGFTIFSLILLVLSGKWREHLLPLSFMLGYLMVLVMSSFAHSERFHQPIMPLEMMFATYGFSVFISQKKRKRWFIYWCALIFVIILAWSWFKLVGRGLG